MPQLQLLSFRCFPFLHFSDISSKPYRREQDKSNAGADGTDVVWPGRAQETGVSIVSRGDDRDGGRALQVSQPMTVYQRTKGRRRI